MAQVSSKAAAVAAAMVVPFHCIICFDEFNFTDKTPMVLPCGHTYVCSACTKRLKRCMECREPLFWTPPSTTSQGSVQGGHTSHQFTVMQQRCHARYGTPIAASPSPSKINPQRHEPVPLPISRNVVMMAMMESAQRQKMLQQSKSQNEHQEAEFSDTEGEEMENIITALEAMAGPCGTYAVKDQLGVAILPNDPRKGYSLSSNRFANETPQEPYKIQKGQTVQIVSVEDGVYQLARNQGYIVASESQLVKVNGPQEKSCQLQGMLNLVKKREEELRKRLQQIESLYDGLGQRILEELELEPSYPIITEDPDLEADLDRKETPNNISILDDQRAESPPPKLGSRSLDHPQSRSPREIVATPSDSGEGEIELMDSSSDIVNLAPRTPNTIDNSDIREVGSYYADENFFPGANTPYMCTDFTFFRGEPGGPQALEEQMFDDPSAVAAARMRSHLEPPTLQYAGATPPITQSSSTGMIDFSTGLSGHRGFYSSKSRGPGRAQQPMSHRQIRMMGEHRGISLFRGSQGPSKKQSP